MTWSALLALVLGPLVHEAFTEHAPGSGGQGRVHVEHCDHPTHADAAEAGVESACAEQHETHPCFAAALAVSPTPTLPMGAVPHRFADPPRIRPGRPTPPRPPLAAAPKTSPPLA